MIKSIQKVLLGIVTAFVYVSAIRMMIHIYETTSFNLTTGIYFGFVCLFIGFLMVVGASLIWYGETDS